VVDKKSIIGKYGGPRMTRSTRGCWKKALFRAEKYILNGILRKVTQIDALAFFQARFASRSSFRPSTRSSRRRSRSRRGSTTPTWTRRARCRFYRTFSPVI
jgi:hypothetical protein